MSVKEFYVFVIVFVRSFFVSFCEIRTIRLSLFFEVNGTEVFL